MSSLARLTLAFDPTDRSALSRFVDLARVDTRPDAVRLLAARLTSAPATLRTRLAAHDVQPDTSAPRTRLDARIAEEVRAAFLRWCGDDLRPQDALRAALHLAPTDAEVGAALGLRATGKAPPPAPPPARRPVSRRRRFEPWPQPKAAAPIIDRASDYATRKLLARVTGGQAGIQFAPEWSPDVSDAIADLIQALPAGRRVTVVLGLRRTAWQRFDEELGDVRGGADWALVPVPRPAAVARELLRVARQAGAGESQARVHTVEDRGSVGAVVELVVWGRY